MFVALAVFACAVVVVAKSLFVFVCCAHCCNVCLLRWLCSCVVVVVVCVVVVCGYLLLSLV